MFLVKDHLLNVLNIPKEGVSLRWGKENPFPIYDVSIEKDGFGCRDLFFVEIDIEKDKDFVYIKGGVKGEIYLECVRCLEVFSRHVDISFDRVYTPVFEIKEEVELRKSDLKVDFYRENVIDIHHLILEEIYLDIPMKPLCKPNCKGLCPVCGKNLNKEVCHCKEYKNIDPRFELLKELKSKLKFK